MEHLPLCCVSPHPPIMVPEIGGPEVQKVSMSIRALESVGREIAEISPDTIVIMSPHSPVYSDTFTVKVSPMLGGSFSQFGAPQVRIDTTCDVELSRAIAAKAESKGIPCETVGGEGFPARGAADLDHGILVPLHFLAAQPYPLACISLSFLDMKTHYRLGTAVREAIRETGRKCVFVASGDLSHRLIPDAPAGYSPRAKEFDSRIASIVASGDLSLLLDLDPELATDAGECGLRSIITMAGILDGYARESEVLSYEGPFGVGYMVARVKPGEKDPSFSLPGEEER